MGKNDFNYVRLVGEERREGPSLESISHHWKREREVFLFISPHDDDAIIGGGILIQGAIKENVPVHLAVVTDGSMGYCSMREKNSISQIRKDETFDSCKILGMRPERVHWLGFPDCQLSYYQGRRPAKESDTIQSHGFTGMQHAFTELLRTVRPTQIFLATSSDLHPDHRIVYDEMLISCFHAAGAIWPELGKPLSKPPYIHEYAVYCNFPKEPKLQIVAPQPAFDKKLKAILAFKSQKQIKAVVDSVKRSGPMEYLRPVQFSMYNPAWYHIMFEKEYHQHLTRR